MITNITSVSNDHIKVEIPPNPAWRNISPGAFLESLNREKNYFLSKVNEKIQDEHLPYSFGTKIIGVMVPNNTGKDVFEILLEGKVPLDIEYFINNLQTQSSISR